MFSIACCSIKNKNVKELSTNFENLKSHKATCEKRLVLWPDLSFLQKSVHKMIFSVHCLYI